jgi:hypothetical protein
MMHCEAGASPLKVRVASTAVLPGSLGAWGEVLHVDPQGREWADHPIHQNTYLPLANLGKRATALETNQRARGRIWRSAPAIGPSILPLPEQARERAFAAWLRPFPGQATYGTRELVMEHASEIRWDGALRQAVVFQIAHPAKVTFDEDQNPSLIGPSQKRNSAPSHAVYRKSDSKPLDQFIRIDGATVGGVGPQQAPPLYGKALKKII